MIKVTKNRHPRIAHEVAVLLLVPCCRSDKLQATLVRYTSYLIVSASLNPYFSVDSSPAHGLLVDRATPFWGRIPLSQVCLSNQCRSLLILSHSSIIIGNRQSDVFVRFIEHTAGYPEDCWKEERGSQQNELVALALLKRFRM